VQKNPSHRPARIFGLEISMLACDQIAMQIEKEY
jgi:hypothetical protein